MRTRSVEPRLSRQGTAGFNADSQPGSAPQPTCCCSSVWQKRQRKKPIHVTLWSHIDSRCNKILFKNLLERVPPNFHDTSYMIFSGTAFHTRPWLVLFCGRVLNWAQGSRPAAADGRQTRVFLSELCVCLLFILQWEVLPLIVDGGVKTESPLSFVTPLPICLNSDKEVHPLTAWKIVRKKKTNKSLKELIWADVSCCRLETRRCAPL